MEGIINNYGNLDGEMNATGNVEGQISSAELVGGQVVGMRGLKGEKGDKGDNGADGQDGADGNGIASAVLNDDYTLTLTFTDGTTYTTPSIRGQQGADGQDGTNGQDGQDGKDGVSPTASVTKSGNTATITITDAQGTTTAQISDGEGGASDWSDITNKPSTFPPSTHDHTDMVHTNGTETINGDKTFTGIINLGNHGDIYGGDHEDVIVFSNSRGLRVDDEGYLHRRYGSSYANEYELIDEGNISNYHDSTKADASHTHTKSQITDFPAIPSKTSELTNDSGFIDSSYHDSSKADTSHTHTKSNITDFTHTHTVSDITDFPTIPTAPLVKVMKIGSASIPSIAGHSGRAEQEITFTNPTGYTPVSIANYQSSAYRFLLGEYTLAKGSFKFSIFNTSASASSTTLTVSLLFVKDSILA